MEVCLTILRRLLMRGCGISQKAHDLCFRQNLAIVQSQQQGLAYGQCGRSSDVFGRGHELFHFLVMVMMIGRGMAKPGVRRNAGWHRYKPLRGV